ncbi:unnamed protein product [Calypogeia fissa]
MDMSLLAPKLFVAELQAAVQVEMQGSEAFALGELTFQRVWLQGIVVTPLEHGTLVLDDGSAVIELFLQKAHQAQVWEPGMYVLVNGRISKDTVPFIEVHKIVDLTSQPVREAAWHLEVAEAHEMFYDHLMAGV